MARPETSNRTRRFPPALTVLVVGAVLYFAREVLIPIAMAVLLTFLLVPLVRRLERFRLPRVVAVGVAVGMTAVGVSGVVWLVQGQVVELATNLPQYKENIRTKLKALRSNRGGVLDEAGKTLAELGREITTPDEEGAKTERAAPTGASGELRYAPWHWPTASSLTRSERAGVGSTSKERATANESAGSSSAEAPSEARPLPVTVVDGPTPPLTYAKTLLGPFLSRAATAGIVVVFAIFMLMKREDLRNRILWLIGERAMHVSTPAFDDAAKRVSSYLLMQTVANGLAGTAVGIGLYLIGVPSAAAWGLLIGLFRYIPYVGAPLAGFLPLALSMATAPDWTQPLMVIALVAGVEILMGNVVEPLLYGAKTGLSPVAILAATVFWAWLWGPVGLLLATPLTVCVAVIGRHVPDLAFLEALLGDEPVLSPPAALYQRLLAGDQEEAGRIIDAFAKDKELVEVYDMLLVPALRLAELDRHRGVLTPENERTIDEMMSLIVDDAGVHPLMMKNADARQVFCLPARDRSDEIAARMLANLLTASGLQARALSAEAMTGEIVEQIAQATPAVVCVSAIPPRAALHSRVLCKRLRARFPELPLVVGVWSPEVDAQVVRQSLGANGLEFVVTSLRQALDQIRTLAGTVGHHAAPEVVVPGAASALPA